MRHVQNAQSVPLGHSASLSLYSARRTEDCIERETLDVKQVRGAVLRVPDMGGYTAQMIFSYESETTQCLQPKLLTMHTVRLRGLCPENLHVVQRMT